MSTMNDKPRRRQALLTHDEERILYNRRRRGDRAAAEELARRNLGLAYHLAKTTPAHGIPPDEAVAIGMEALAVGIARFDPAKGRLANVVSAQFMHLAQKWRASFMRPLRLPAHGVPQFQRIKRAYDKLMDGAPEGYSPSDSRLAGESGTAVGMVRAWRENHGSARSLNIDADEVTQYGSVEAEATVRAAGSDTPADAIREMRGLIEVYLAELTKDHAFVLRQRFGLNDEAREYTLEEIARKRRITRERIRQIEFQAKRVLRTRMRKDKIDLPALLAA